METTIDAKIYEENVKKTKVERVVDYLNEHAYLSDLYIEEDNYIYFFEQLYNYFASKDLLEFYVKAMFEFISKCVCEKKEINVQMLIDDLDKLKYVNIILPTNKQLEELEIAFLSATIKPSKKKVLTQTN